jgi:hypothetical protein
MGFTPLPSTKDTKLETLILRDLCGFYPRILPKPVPHT